MHCIANSGSFQPLMTITARSDFRPKAQERNSNPFIRGSSMSRSTKSNSIESIHEFASSADPAVDFHADPAGDSAWVEIDDETLEVVRFDAVDLQASGAITVCMSPRGTADPRCNSFSGLETVTFEARGESRSLDILPLGKIIGN